MISININCVLVTVIVSVMMISLVVGTMFSVRFWLLSLCSHCPCCLVVEVVGVCVVLIALFACVAGAIIFGCVLNIILRVLAVVCIFIVCISDLHVHILGFTIVLVIVLSSRLTWSWLCRLKHMQRKTSRTFGFKP